MLHAPAHRQHRHQLWCAARARRAAPAALIAPAASSGAPRAARPPAGAARSRGRALAPPRSGCPAPPGPRRAARPPPPAHPGPRRAAEDTESEQCHLGAIIVRDLSVVVSNYRSQKSLQQYCEEQNVIGISNVDTRQLTKLLRSTGCLVGAISTDASKSDAELLEMTRGWTIVGKDLLSVVSCTEPYEWKDPTHSEWEFNASAKAAQGAAQPFLVVAYDFGIKHNILRRLAAFGCKIVVVPATYPAAEVLKMNPDGVFFSNGPGDPSAAPYAVDNAKQIIGKKPTFGICMGHQLMGQAFGGARPAARALRWLRAAWGDGSGHGQGCRRRAAQRLWPCSGAAPLHPAGSGSRPRRRPLLQLPAPPTTPSTHHLHPPPPPTAGKTFKLKFGHHGGNHPIRYNPTGRIEISAQNHNFAVDPATLPAGAPRCWGCCWGCCGCCGCCGCWGCLLLAAWADAAGGCCGRMLRPAPSRWQGAAYGLLRSSTTTCARGHRDRRHTRRARCQASPPTAPAARRAPPCLPAGVEVTHINLNDGTCAGMLFAEKAAMTIQYHPEASPGPHDADICFEQFVDMMRAGRAAPAKAAA